MDLRVLRATLRKNLLILYRAYPVSFMVGNLLTGIYTSVGAWFLYHLMFGGKLSADFVEKAGTSDYMSYVITGCLVYLFVTRTCLNVSRSLITELLPSFAKEILISAGMLAVVCVIIRAAERHVRRAGNLTLF